MIFNLIDCVSGYTFYPELPHLARGAGLPPPLYRLPLPVLPGQAVAGVVILRHLPEELVIKQLVRLDPVAQTLNRHQGSSDEAKDE